MRTCCYTSLAFCLKFLNFLQTFVGLCMIIYSVYMLNQWNHYIPISPPPLPIPPPSAPSPALSRALFLNSENFGGSYQFNSLNSAVDMVSGFDGGVVVKLSSSVVDMVSGFDDGVMMKLPAPWFIYSFMSVGIMLCCVTCIGHIAAEAINGCCLCFYTLLTIVLLLLEAAFVAFIAFDRHWEKDLPLDPTGELDSFRSFIEENVEICKWIGITIVSIQALSLLLAFILRSMVSTQKRDYDCEDNYDVEGRIREPLLNPQSSQTSGSNKGDNRGAYSDIWSSRIREKYGLNSSVTTKSDELNQNSSMSPRSRQ